MPDLDNAPLRVAPAPTVAFALLETVADACFALDGDGRLTYLNGAAATLCGCEREAAIGQPAASLLPPTAGDALAALLHHAAVGGQPGEAAVQLADGERRFAVRAWREGDAVLVVCRDAAAGGDAATHERERRSQQIADSTASFLTYLDAEGRFRFANAAALRLFGRGREQMVGRTLVELFGPQADANIRPHWERAMRGETVRFRAHFPAEGPNAVGDHVAGREFETVFTPDVDAAGRVRGVVSVGTDITDHVRAEEAARQNERWVQLIVNSASAAIRYIDTAQRYRFSNRAGLEWFGLDWAQVEGRTVAEIVGPEAYALLRPGLERALGGETIRFRVRMPDAAHSRNPHTAGHDHEVAYTPDMDAAGRVRGVVAVATDVSALVRAQEAAERGERQVRLILDSTEAGVILFDREERCRYANPTALAGFGRTPEEVIGRPFGEVVGAGVYALVRPELDRALRGEGVQFYVNIPADADLPVAGRDFLMVYTPEVDDTGAVQGVVAVNTDITDHMRAEEALRRSEERYRSLVNATASIVWVVNAAGMAIGESAGWEAYTGQAPAEYWGYGWLAAVHPDDTPALRAQWQETFGTPVPVTLEFRLRRRDGAYRSVVARRVPVLALDGTVREWIGTIADIHDQRRAEAERAEFSARLMALFRAENLGVAWGEGEGVTDANDAFLRMTGYERADVVRGGLDWRGFVPPEDGPRLRRFVADSVAHGWVPPFAQTFVRKDGERVPVVLGGSCLNPDPFRFLIFILDDTERSRAEAAVRESEERYRLASEAVAGLLYDYDRHAGRVTYSPGLFDLVGYRPDEAPADPGWWERQTHPDDQPTAQAAFAAALGDPAAPRYSIEYRVRHRDGHDVWVWDRGYFVRDGAGAVVRSVGSVVDITERMRVEAALRESEARYRTLFDSIDEGFCVIEPLYDRDGNPEDFRYIETNPAFEQQSGFVGATGRRIRELVPGFEIEWIAVYGEVARTGEPVRFEGYVEGLGRWFDVYAFALGGRERGTVACLFTDITGRKRAEDEMRGLQEDAVRLRDEFLASVSHELRTPLTAITAGLGLLDDSGGERLLPPERGLLRNARRNAAHLTRLVDDLVVFNQVKEDRLQLDLHPLDLRTLVAEVAASMGILLDRKGQRVALDLDGLPLVQGDNRRLRQVFVNLLDNAHRHTPHGTAITVRGRADAGAVIVAVEDTGGGIPPAQRERIFERSVVGGAVTSGTGLGLAIARSLVELHGGAIWAEAAPGGAAFVLRLPVAADATSD